MSTIFRFFKSSIGAKVMMAVTGIMMLGWLVAHLSGNLLMFLGQKDFNAYAKFLKHDMIKVVWATRIVLLGAIIVHIASAIRLVTMNDAARPVKYQNPHHSSSTYASRTMKYSGLIVLAFLIYHLLHFTLGVVQHDHFVLKTPDGYHDAYRMAVLGFQHPLVSIFYLIAQALLFMHLSHGVSSFFQTMGLNNETYQPIWSKAGPAVATALFLGFASIPVAVLLGIIK